MAPSQTIGPQAEYNQRNNPASQAETETTPQQCWESCQNFDVYRSLAGVYNPGRPVAETHGNNEHENLKPAFLDVAWPGPNDVPYQDKGLKGDPKYRHLLNSATEVFDYSPKIGTEVSGISLAQLTDAQKSDLARLVAVRGVVFFRNQVGFDTVAQQALGRYYGVLHRHPPNSVPQHTGLEDAHVVFTTDTSVNEQTTFAPTVFWHSDVRYPRKQRADVLMNGQMTHELQPPSYTCLKLLSDPARGGGGDTLWSSQYAAYDRLSSHMQRYLETLTALHSVDVQTEGSRALGRSIRRAPITTEHPLIRVHPVTGWKFLFFNPMFVTKIVGVPKTEGDIIVKYLNEVMATTQESHARFQWSQNDVAIWDSRITTHSVSYGFAPHRGLAVRVACHGEKPYFHTSGTSQEEDFRKRHRPATIRKDGAGPSHYKN